MRSRDPRRVRGIAALAAVSALALSLAGASDSKKVRVESSPPKVDESVGDLASIQSHAGTKLEGVGLVVGLDNTGVDPPPSYYRQKLLEDMRKAGIESAESYLKDSRFSMVIIRMTIPPGASPKDRIDADVELPPGCGTKSLAGGRLLECRLREMRVAGGAVRDGPEFATVQGPVMTGNDKEPGNFKLGRVLGGGRVKKEIPYQLILNENRQSFRVSKLLETVVNQRFPQSQGMNQKGSAEAKTDRVLVLKVPQVYHENQERFFRIVKLLPVVDTPEQRTRRLAVWQKQLLDPKTAGVASLRLEGIGITAADTLKTALVSPNAQVRFFAAESLAYLNDPEGAEMLGQAVIGQPEFRAYALAALGSMDQPASHMKLRKLMDDPDGEIRYGAFNALRILSPDDPFLGQVPVLDDPKPADDEDVTAPDSMAVALTRATNRRRPVDPFSLYLVDCEGPPMVHLARTRRCEIVVFGRGQTLLTPLVLGTGPFLLNASEGDESIKLTKIVPSRYGEQDQKVECTLGLGDVIREAATMGASYPEIVTVLQAAERQKNLSGPLVIDALPGTSPVYDQAVVAGKDTTKKDDALKRTSGEPDSPPKRRTLLDRILHPGKPAPSTD